MADSVNVRVSDSDKLYPNAVVVKVGAQEIIAGRDGVSPVVTTEAIPHGNRVTITDAVGEHAFDVMDGASAYEQAVAGGYEGTEAEFAEDLAGFSDKADTAETAAASAAQSAQSAINSASNAATEAGEAAASAATALTHRDAADSSAQSAAASATSAGNSASAAAASASAANGSATSASASESNAANSATNAASSETAAAASESAAAASAAAASNSAAAAAQSASAIEEYEHDAEAWAIGKRGGTDVDSSDATYQNNSKYYAEQAAASSSAASSAASAAAQSATEAASEADSSKSYSRSSYISSTMASGSATAAADAQTAAETAAATAEGHATNAASSATAASGSATAAATSESNAADSAAAAAASEAEAKRVEESIPADYTDLAEDVSNLKSAVNDPVTGLDTKAPIIINSASGDIASFTDGADNMPIKQLTVNVEPIQDLHGYDNPWPAGGGKNKFAFPYAEGTKTNNGVTFTVNDDGTVRINGTATARGVFYLQNDVSNFHPDAGTYYVSKGSECQSATIIVEAYNGTTWKKNLATVGTAASVQFTVDYDGYDRVSAYFSVPSGNSPSNEIVKPMIRLASETDATFSPYSNICPISGRTSATVTRTGANIWDEEWELGYLDPSTGQNASSRDCIRAKNYSPIAPNTPYYVKTPNVSEVNCKLFFYDDNKSFISWRTLVNETYTVPSNARYFRFFMSNQYGVTYNNDISINHPATDTQYHPYEGNTYTIQLGDTVYGGTVDAVQGVLTVKFIKVTINSVALWPNTTNPNGTAVYKIIEETNHIVSSDKRPYMLSNIFKYGKLERTSAPLYQYGGADGINTAQTFILPSTITTTAEANQWFVDNPTECIFMLATPIEITLLPTQITTLLGTNNIWADAGPVDVDYRADTKLYVDQKIAAAIAAALNA